ncbi:MAG: NADH-quinone oxidoreductase subunit NuoN [Burkholderiales bacterium]|nr:NADH-quinone oxidoreductase subunit NuoN [Pseudomonadota bacterium]
MTIADLRPAYAEIFLLTAASLILVLDLFIGEARRTLIYGATLLALGGCALITIMTADPEVVRAFSGGFVDDPLSDALKLAIYLSVVLMLVFSRGYLAERAMLHGEFLALTLFATLGMMVMVSAHHFVTLYLGLELLSLCLYAMVAMQRDSAVATEAAMKYFILGALSSGILLYGMSMVYGATGSLDINEIADAILNQQANIIVLGFGVVFVVAGIGFKLGAAPFHMWVPDVYQGAPTAVTLFIGSAPKLAAFGFIIRLLVEGLQESLPDWQSMLIILAVLSLAVGEITAISQSNFKRLLAYSSISHMGYLMLGLLSGTMDGYSAAMFYVVVYTLMTLAAFGMIMLLSRAGFEADKLSDFKGLNARSPWYAFVMLLLMLSMIGLPPTVGFYAKLAVLQAVADAGFVWLAVAAVMFSLIGAFYYLRVVRLMYFEAPEHDALIAPPTDVAVLMSINGIAILALGILPQSLMAVCLYAIESSL